MTMLDGGLQSLDGGSTHRFTPSADEEYTTDAVHFDGTNDGLELDSALTGSTNTKNLLFSAWVIHDVDNSTDIIFAVSTQERFIVYHSSSDNLEIRLKNDGSAWPALATLVNYSASSVITAGGWHHILIAADMANTTFQVYINDTVQAGNSPTVTDDVIGLGSVSDVWQVGVYHTGALEWRGDMADVYMTNEYLDISVEANRRKFIDADGKPVDLGADGSTPTDTQPLIYFRADASTPDNFANNLGSGEDFTVIGALTNASSTPSD